MTATRRDSIGPDVETRKQARNAHGRWSALYLRADVSAEAARAAFFGVYDSERWTFALAEGEGARLMAECLTEFLWTLHEPETDWPGALHAWLADTGQWQDIGAGAVRFVCGRIDRRTFGGALSLAWLGMRGVGLLGPQGAAIPLDRATAADEVWTPQVGEDLPALHSHTSPLTDVRRLVVLTRGAESLIRDLPDMTPSEMALALESLADGAGADLLLFDLTLDRVPVSEETVRVVCRWTDPALCELEWEPLPQATGYRVEWSPGPDFAEPELVAEMMDGRQVRYRLAPPVDHARYYRVVPLIGNGTAAPSEPVTALPLTLPVPVLGAPRWVNDGALRLRWTPVPVATGYEVETAPTEDFEEGETRIVYRGERPEVTLPSSTPPGRYYRVRALNALYAPDAPSAWSEPVRGPGRLMTPVFTQVTSRYLAWERVPGAGVYEVRVTPPDRDPEQGDELFTEEPSIAASGEAATYQVRALRARGNERGASEWTAPVTISPRAQQPTQRGLAIPALILVALAALAVGVAIGVTGPQVFRGEEPEDVPVVSEVGTPDPRPFVPCVALEPPEGVRLPVYAAPDETAPVQYPDLAPLTVFYARLDAGETGWRAVVGQTAAGVPVIGWVLLPPEVDEAALYGGLCDPSGLPVWEG